MYFGTYFRFSKFKVLRSNLSITRMVSSFEVKTKKLCLPLQTKNAFLYIYKRKYLCL